MSSLSSCPPQVLFNDYFDSFTWKFAQAIINILVCRKAHILWGVRDAHWIYTWNDETLYFAEFLAKGLGKSRENSNWKIVFSDRRSYEGKWIYDLRSDGVLTCRTDQVISLDYGLDRGTFEAEEYIKT